MLVIYTQKITPRITYIFKHLCTHLLGIPIKFTSKIEEFIAHEGAKMSYGKQALGNELFVQKTELLMEQGFSEIEIKIQPWDETICFFAVSEASNLPFDIFSASFYLLSRYEEYLPHVKDEFGRFPPTESTAYSESFLQKPVVDIWSLKFLDILLERFPDLEHKTKTYKPSTVIATQHCFAYRNKGILRLLIGAINDLVRFDLRKVTDRFRVWFHLKKDPYSVFDDLVELIKTHRANFLFMFQLSDFSIHDRNIGHNRIPHRAIIKSVGDYSKVGLLLGYNAVDDIQVLRKEKLRMEEIVHSNLDNVLNFQYNLNLPENYNNLTELEIDHDYSMGYPDKPGFRAGTCSSFLFYDINMEVTTPLRIHPYVFSSACLEELSKTKTNEILTHLLLEVKEVKGTFRSIFRNIDFSDYADKNYSYSLLKKIHEID